MVCAVQERSVTGCWLGNLKENAWRLSRRREDNTKMELQEIRIMEGCGRGLSRSG